MRPDVFNNLLAAGLAAICVVVIYVILREDTIQSLKAENEALKRGKIPPSVI